MIVTPQDYYRARQILREWRKRDVKYVRLYHGNNGSIENGYGCEPSESGTTINEGDMIFPVPPSDELPESDTEYTDKAILTEAEGWVATAVSDFWDDPTVSHEAS